MLRFTFFLADYFDAIFFSQYINMIVKPDKGVIKLAAVWTLGNTFLNYVCMVGAYMTSVLGYTQRKLVGQCIIYCHPLKVLQVCMSFNF